MYAASSSTPTLASVEWCWCFVVCFGRTLVGQCVNVHCCRLCVVDKRLVGQCVKLMYAASSSTPTLASVEWCWCLVVLSCVTGWTVCTCALLAFVCC